MTKGITKKTVLLVTTLLFFIAIQVVVAQTATPTPTSPYHTPEDTGVNFDNTLVIGALLYGLGVLFTSGAKIIGAKFGGIKLRR